MRSEDESMRHRNLSGSQDLIVPELVADHETIARGLSVGIWEAGGPLRCWPRSSPENVLDHLVLDVREHRPRYRRDAKMSYIPLIVDAGERDTDRQHGSYPRGQIG